MYVCIWAEEEFFGGMHELRAALQNHNGVNCITTSRPQQSCSHISGRLAFAIFRGVCCWFVEDIPKLRVGFFFPDTGYLGHLGDWRVGGTMPGISEVLGAGEFLVRILEDWWGLCSLEEKRNCWRVAARLWIQNQSETVNLFIAWSWELWRHWI